jgi:hypothetical protein
MTNLISDAELARLDRLEKARTPGAWYSVGLPWHNDPSQPGWIVAGHFDPHQGKMVLDGVQVDSADGEDDAAIDADFERQYKQADADLEFAAAAATHMRKLLDSLRIYKRAFEIATGGYPRSAQMAAIRQAKQEIQKA